MGTHSCYKVPICYHTEMQNKNTEEIPSQRGVGAVGAYYRKKPISGVLHPSRIRLCPQEKGCCYVCLVLIQLKKSRGKGRVHKQLKEKDQPGRCIGQAPYPIGVVSMSENEAQRARLKNACALYPGVRENCNTK